MNLRTVAAGLALAICSLPASLPAQAFTPGDRVIYQENFSQPRDSVMRHLRNVHSRVSLQRHGNAPGLHARTPATFEIVLPERLPERYTLEFDFYIPGQNHVAVHTLGANGAPQGMVLCGPHEVTTSNSDGDDRTVSLDEIEAIGGTTEERVNHCAILVEADRVRTWINNVPAADEEGITLGRSNRLRVEFAGVEDPTLLDQNIPVWLTNIRIAGFSQD
ncbi:MAG TPA: hypothetical protein VHG08_29295 [Longimicrobium sp.]|nr:hypothetical protein [Longimicrobium sp.]